MEDFFLGDHSVIRFQFMFYKTKWGVSRFEFLQDQKTLPTFSQRKQFAHVLAGSVKPIEFPFLTQQFYQIQVTVVIIGIDGQLKKHCQNSNFISKVLQKPS